VPVWAPGNGDDAADTGLYALAAGAPGVDAAQRLPTFNDDFLGAGPDVGAMEAGAPPMKFGRAAARAPTGTAPAPSLSVPFRVNAGGGTVGSFVADTGDSGGTAVTNWTGAIDASGVASPAPDAVYQAERYGTFAYGFSGLPPGGALTLRLHFCENYHSAAGQRSFDVGVNGVAWLTSFDVFQVAGATHKAVVRELRTTADANGRLTVTFTAKIDQALVNGLELLP
jgi:hypothetical protein